MCVVLAPGLRWPLGGGSPGSAGGGAHAPWRAHTFTIYTFLTTVRIYTCADSTGLRRSCKHIQIEIHSLCLRGLCAVAALAVTCQGCQNCQALSGAVRATVI
eukprot:1788345-Prymnesium_polylepis.1